jgi:hypothetical protein
MESPSWLQRGDQLLQVITKRIGDLGESALQVLTGSNERASSSSWS